MHACLECGGEYLEFLWALAMRYARVFVYDLLLFLKEIVDYNGFGWDYKILSGYKWHIPFMFNLQFTDLIFSTNFHKCEIWFVIDFTQSNWQARSSLARVENREMCGFPGLHENVITRLSPSFPT